MHLKKQLMKSDLTLILGDFNIDYKMDESLHENQIYLIENLFLLTQMINKPTRVTTSSSTCIDHLLSSIPQKHIICDVAKIFMSDHYMIYTCIITHHGKETTYYSLFSWLQTIWWNSIYCFYEIS